MFDAQSLAPISRVLGGYMQKEESVQVVCKGAIACAVHFCGHNTPHAQGGGCLSPCHCANGVQGSLCAPVDVVEEPKPTEEVVCENAHVCTLDACKHYNPHNYTPNIYCDKICEVCDKICFEVDGGVFGSKCVPVSSLKKEVSVNFKNVSISVEQLVANRACDEGVIWFVKEFGTKQICLNPLYTLLRQKGKYSWATWLEKTFKECIEVQKINCCEKMARAIASEAIFPEEKGMSASIWTKEGVCWTMTHCPFCGKKIGG